MLQLRFLRVRGRGRPGFFRLLLGKRFFLSRLRNSRVLFPFKEHMKVTAI
jgi:hypothetical protein